jgi:cytochrome c oxidase assembly factor CtaG
MVVYLPLALVWAAFTLHLAGERRVAVLRRRPRNRQARWRACSFYAGLLTIVIALASPIDSLAQKLFWVHMIQHVLLLTIAAPLIVLGAPWMSIWRPLPLDVRRRMARTVAWSPWLAPVRAAGRALGRPLGAWLAFSIDLVLWHIPAAYDLTLNHVWVHAFEHITFLLFGILLWAQVLDSPPLRSHLRPDQRVYYIISAAVVGWLLSLVLAFAPRPLYPVYAHIANRPGGISALVDQQLAAGMMLGPGSLTMTVFVFFGLYRWLDAPDDDGPAGTKLRRRSAAGGVPR